MKTVVKICSTYWWEWKTENSNFTPIVTDIKVASPGLLAIAHCGCKGYCSAKFNCRISGSQCSSTCKGCHELICSNAPVIETTSDQDNYQRRFLDAFKLY